MSITDYDPLDPRKWPKGMKEEVDALQDGFLEAVAAADKRLKDCHEPIFDRAPRFLPRAESEHVAARVAAKALLEESQVQWHRDWDAVLIGWVIGALMGILSTVAVLVALK